MSLELWKPAGEALLLLAAMFAAGEAGRILARRRAQRRGDDGPAESGVIAAAVFGLLGLLLAFEFAGAAGRLQARRDISLREVNAIGTAWLRLDLLPADEQPVLRDLFRRYLDTRIRARRALPDVAAAKQEAAAGEPIQREIWSRAVAACRRGDPGVARLVIPALNDMIDVTTTATVAVLTRSPALVIGVLSAVALLAALLAGYSTAALHRGNVTRALLFVILAVTFYLIRDLDQPRGGAIQIGAPDEAFQALRVQMDQASGVTTR